jgi:tetratricopeptide (TPR) repeat protein
MFEVGAKAFFATALAILLSAAVSSIAAAADRKVCDVKADFALGQQDYSTAAKLHRSYLRAHPNDALAHYHLGFAYGMMGLRDDEIGEYAAALNLGLRKWDLFLNLGRAYLEQNELPRATDALETAVLLGPEHAEAHFNLALVYERQSKLGPALQEITASRRLAPQDLDAANTNAIICAEMGDFSCARNVWTNMLKNAPDYSPARTNLAMLGQSAEHLEPSTVSLRDGVRSGG